MAPPGPARRRRRVTGRLLRTVASLVFVVGFAYLIHRPLVQLYQNFQARIQTPGTGPNRLFGGSITPTITKWLSAQQQQTEEQIRSQMLKANSSSGGGGQQSTAGADASALLSDKLHSDTVMAGGVTVVEKPLGVAKATADKAATAAAAAVDAVGTAAANVAKAAGGGAVAGGAAAAVDQLGGKDACLPTKWTGNAADYKLTKTAVSCLMDEHNTIMVTWANFHYQDFVMNWVDHVRNVGVTAYLVGAMDDKLLEVLAVAGVHTFSMNSGLTTEDFGWGSKNFHKMGREKINLVYLFTKMGFSILVSDVDTVWMRNPLPYMAQYPEADVLTSSDHLRETATDGGLEHYPEAGSAANIGIMLVRPSCNDFAKEWVDKILADENYWDQNAFNDLMIRGAVFEPRRSDRLFLGYGGKYKFGILPVSMFCSGHTYFTQRMPFKLGLDPYVVHATFQFSGTPGKRWRLREALLWNDPPEYFDRAGGYLAYKADVPAKMLAAAVPKEEPLTLNGTLDHFTLIHHQLLQMRNAWAISQALGRALVFPKIWSAMDRWWAPHSGKIPGSSLDLPFEAPFDHIVDLEGCANGINTAIAWMQIPRDMNEFGPMIEYREYSFLQNKRLTPAVKASSIKVVVCKAGETSAMCSDGSAAAAETKGAVYIRPGLTDAQLKVALQNVKDRKIMTFSTMLGAFGGFADEMVGRRFQKRIAQYASIFCCVNAHPGHVFYDWWWDTVPHTDRFGRIWSEPWKPTTGP